MPDILTSIIIKPKKQPAAFASSLLLLATCCLLPWHSTAALAQSQPPNPLTITAPDPLLPPADRPLTEAEREQLKIALDALNLEAQQLQLAGKSDAAFAIWYRELRLRRSLGTVAEVEALGRVGEIAWQENRTPDSSAIDSRLQAIATEAEAKTPNDNTLWRALGKAGEQSRSPKVAANGYEKLLASARQQQDKIAILDTLKTLAPLYLNWLEYAPAAERYEELFANAKSQSDRPSEIDYLQKLAYIYHQLQQPQKALLSNQQLEVLYLQDSKFANLLPALKLAIASDCELLQQGNDASQNYQEAYRLALAQQQLAYGVEALQKLGALYAAYKQPDYALQVYEVLLQLQQQTYDQYGMMQTYDLMGQIYLSQQKYDSALASWRQGLELARLLKHQESYFATQIQRLENR